jgi:hypothetical protein
MLSQRTIGDVRVSAVGLGCMPLSNGRMVDNREQAVDTIHAALDAGITLLDTANIYAPSWDAVGHNEALVAEPSIANDDPYDAGWLVILKPEEWDSVKTTLVPGTDVTAPYEAKMDAEGFGGCG